MGVWLVGYNLTGNSTGNLTGDVSGRGVTWCGSVRVGVCFDHASLGVGALQGLVHDDRP